MPAAAIDSSQCVEVVFDVRNQTLKYGTAERQLTPKAAAVLIYLCSRPRQLSSQDELLEAVWPGVCVVAAVLKNVIKEIRQCLGDNARSPRFIQTVHRRGYRFIGEQLVHVVDTGRSMSTLPRNTFENEDYVFLGRATEQQALSEEWAFARSRNCRGVLISGDPGIGKSSLVSHWLAAQAPKSGLHATASVTCNDPAGQPPYATMLDILNQLSQSFDRNQYATLLAHYTPTWLQAMPWLSSPQNSTPETPVGSASMSHPSHLESALLFEALSDMRPMIIVVENLHRCDPYTVQLLNSLCIRRSRCRLLIIATYCGWRASGTQAAEVGRSHEALPHDKWRDIRLGPLGSDSLLQTLDRLTVDKKLNNETAQLIQHRSDGHPLFVSGVMTHLKQAGSTTSLPPDGPDVFRQRMIREFRLLCSEDQKVLKVASVVTIKAFSAAAVAHLLDTELLEMEARLDMFADRGHWLTRFAGRLWPDGTNAQSYGFRLKPYRDFVYATLPTATRQQLHLQHARRLEKAYADELHLVSENLAYHFERGGDNASAFHYRKLVLIQSSYTDRISRLQLAPSFHPSRPDLGCSRTAGVGFTFAEANSPTQTAPAEDERKRSMSLAQLACR